MFSRQMMSSFLPILDADYHRVQLQLGDLTTRSEPPRFGVAASTLLAIESAVGSAMLVASKERTNVRRSI